MYENGLNSDDLILDDNFFEEYEDFCLHMDETREKESLKKVLGLDDFELL